MFGLKSRIARAAAWAVAFGLGLVFASCGGGSSGEEGDILQVASDTTTVALDKEGEGGGAATQVDCGSALRIVGKPGEWSPTRSGEGSTIVDVPVLLTDPNISLHVKDKKGAETLYRAYYPNVGVGRLFVFFPGTGALPQQYDLLLAAVADLDFHVVGLVYANQLSVNGACKTSADECACLGNMRLEILTGTDASDEVDVSPVDSVDNRLAKLLQYLSAETPSGAWEQFLDADGAVKWENVVLGGHSQGGGHVALMAQRYEVARAVFFSSPADTCMRDGTKSLPDWAQWARKTPSERYYGLSHLKEKGRDNHQMNWDNLGMAGGGCLVDVDGSHPPFKHAQMLVTAIDPASGPCPETGLCEAAHGATIGDTPLDAANKPVLFSVWQYLLTLD